MSLKPGIAVEILLELPSGRQRRLKAILYDGVGERLIVSQTTPPLLTSSKGETVQVSYIAKKDSVMRRFGFSAAISGFVKNYELSEGVYVPAVVMMMAGKPKELNVRKAFRVRPAGDSGISLSLAGGNCPIIDISLFGVGFVQPPYGLSCSPNDRLEGTLVIDGKRFSVKAKVIRVQEKRETKFTALFFTEMEQTLHDALNKKILMLQRKEMKRWF